MPLPLRLDGIKDDESLSGFTMRLAARNGSNGVSGVEAFGAFRLPLQNWTDAELNVLAEASALPRERLANRNLRLGAVSQHDGFRTLLWNRQPLPTLTLAQEPRRACPECMRISPYHRSIWDVRALQYCWSHRLQLAWACPKCSKELGWEQSRIETCACGHPVSRFERIPLDEEDGAPEVVQLLHGLFAGGEVERPERLEGLQLRDTMIVWGLVAEMATGISPATHPNVRKLETTTNLAAGLKVLHGPVEVFAKLASSRLKLADRYRKEIRFALALRLYLSSKGTTGCDEFATALARVLEIEDCKAPLDERGDHPPPSQGRNFGAPNLSLPPQLELLLIRKGHELNDLKWTNARMAAVMSDDDD